jgi:glycosyltransferase involved in cell wall biosynthesis
VKDVSEPLRLAALVEAHTVTGPAKNLLRFCRLAKADGKLDPLLLVFVRGRADDNAFLAAARAAGLNAEPIHEGRRFDIRVVWALRRRLRAFQPHLLQTHSVKSHFLVRFGRLNRLYRWVAFHHGYTATARKTKLYNQLNRWSLRAPRMVITVCGPFAEQLRRHGVPARKTRILHNSVEPAAPVSDTGRDELRRQLGIAPHARVVLTVGRLSYEKAQRDLIDAIAHIRPRWPAVRLVVVGDGPERMRLERQTASLAQRDVVVFAGHVVDVRPVYAIADVFVLPSLSEGSPNVLLEALAAGVPVVATEVGGVRELIEHEANGLLTPPADPKAMADAIERVLSDEVSAAARSREGRKRVLQDFAPETYSARLLELYEQVLDSRGPLTMI